MSMPNSSPSSRIGHVPCAPRRQGRGTASIRVPVWVAVTMVSFANAFSSPPALDSAEPVEEAVSGIPDLSPPSRIALEATPDGRDLRDEAWHRLVAEAEAWPRDPRAFEAATVIRPRWADVVADPDRFRGELLEARGRLEQAAPVRTPGVADDAVVEWFVRTGADRDGPVVQAFVPFEASTAARTGRSVTVVGRLLRRTELEGRDGATRTFATIVGVPLAELGSPGWSPGWVVALATLVLLPVALLVRRRARRSRAARPVALRDGTSESDGMGLRDDLPTDPVEALGVLAAERGEEIR